MTAFDILHCDWVKFVLDKKKYDGTHICCSWKSFVANKYLPLPKKFAINLQGNYFLAMNDVWDKMNIPHDCFDLLP